MSHDAVKKNYFSINKFKYRNNQLITCKKSNIGFLEIIFWADAFEIYLRPAKKRYGYFIKSFYQLKKAQNFIENYDQINFSHILPNDLIIK